jgi:hypothetical protein
MADEEQADSTPATGLGDRVSRLETGQETLSDKLDKILGIVGGGRSEPEDKPAGTGAPNIAHEIRAQLEARDAKAREDAEKTSLREEVAGLKTSLAELAEKPPEAMPRRVEKLMGWR